MRVVFLLVCLSLVSISLANKKVTVVLPGNNKKQINEQCLTNAINVCNAQTSEDHKYFYRFVRTTGTIEQVNKAAAGWTAGHNKFDTISDEDISLRAGTKLKPPGSKYKVQTSSGRKLMAAIPDSFDARTKWPKCIGAIRSQGNCACCWAMAASSVLADRACISNGAAVENLVLSPQDALSCSGIGDCTQGGNPADFFSYANKTGVLEEACLPYASSKVGNSYTPGCATKCTSKTPTREAVHHIAGEPIAFKGRKAIKQEIMTNGPLTMTIMTYSDLTQYRTGIYKPVIKEQKGDHTVKVIGWGKEKGVEYWLIANSWGTSWGDQGYFKLKMGECLSEREIWGTRYLGHRTGPLPFRGSKF